MNLQTSLMGVMSASRDMSVVSNNLANAMTSGFKRSTSQFSTHQGLSGESVTVSSKEGPLKSTQSSFDFALTGVGNFVFGEANPVAGTEPSLSFSRAANLKIGLDGTLINGAGQPLMGLTLSGGGTPKAINILPALSGNLSNLTSITVDAAGSISVLNNKGITTKIGSIAVARFSNEGGLSNIGGSMVGETDRSGPPSFNTAGKGGTGEIRQGALQEANVDITQELLRMIQLQQAYNSNSRGLQSVAEMMRSTVESLTR